jgi:hypothetical protein
MKGESRVDNSTQKLFDQFIKEKEILEGLSPHTIQNYTRGWKVFNKYKAEITEDGVKNFVFGMVKAGLKPGAVNSYSRSSCPFGRMASAQVLLGPTPFCQRDTKS